MSDLNIRRLGHACGARVTGVDLSKPVPAGTIEAIRKAWLEHLVLVFPGQRLDPRSLVAFTRNFGELDDYDPDQIRHMIRTSGVGDYCGRYLEPGAAAAQMAGVGISNNEKAVAALHD